MHDGVKVSEVQELLVLARVPWAHRAPYKLPKAVASNVPLASLVMCVTLLLFLWMLSHTYVMLVLMLLVR